MIAFLTTFAGVLALGAAPTLDLSGGGDDILVTELPKANVKSSIYCGARRCFNVQLKYANGLLEGVIIDKRHVNLSTVSRLVGSDFQISAYSSFSGRNFILRISFGPTRKCGLSDSIQDSVSIAHGQVTRLERMAYINCRMTPIPLA